MFFPGSRVQNHTQTHSVTLSLLEFVKGDNWKLYL